MNIGNIFWGLLAVALLIILNAFFVTAEFAMVSVRRSRITQLVEAGDTPALSVQSLQKSIDRLLSTTQLGITLSSLALGWIGENTMAVFVKRLINQLPLEVGIKTYIAHSIAIPLAFFLIAYLQIVFGELCPKSVALLYSEQIARFLGPAVDTIARIFKPFIFILNQSTRYLLSLVGIQYSGQGWYKQISLEELRLLVKTNQSTGLENSQREMLDNLFQFGDVVAVEVMVPRTKLKVIPIHSTFKTLINEVVSTGHYCYPIIGDSLDDIRGIINFHELALLLAQGKITLESNIDPWVKPVRFVPESSSMTDLLTLMQQSHLKIVIVVDEFGGTSGLITLEDLIAEIISPSSVNSSAELLDLKIIDDQSFLVQAQINLEEVNELLDLNLPLDDAYQTLGGFVLFLFQKIPTQGETIFYENFSFTVEEAEGPRLYQILIKRHNPINTLSETIIEDITLK